MILLLPFAFLAGAATALTPCVLPVLPALLSASGTGGRRRPLGIVTGLTLTHTVTIIGIASVVDGIGLADDTLRIASIVVLALFGTTLLVPRAGHWIAERTSSLARLGPRRDADGFASGLLLGGALGFVYAPCAGPILAAVISVSATAGTSGQLIGVALGCAAGSAVGLLILALGGRRIAAAIRRAGRGPALSRALGAVLLLTGVAMATRLDVRLEETLARHAPAVLVNPTEAFERSGAVQRRLADLRGPARFAETAAGPQADLKDLGPAPEFRGTERWWNTPGDEPLTLHALRGRVVLVDFWP